MQEEHSSNSAGETIYSRIDTCKKDTLDLKAHNLQIMMIMGTILTVITLLTSLGVFTVMESNATTLRAIAFNYPWKQTYNLLSLKLSRLLTPQRSYQPAPVSSII